MAPREDVISSAVSFLQDPSVASSPVEKRIEFLQSKNLTKEEIDIALSRASNDPSSLPPQSQTFYPPPAQYRNAPSSNYQYPYNPYGEWQPPPPEVPKRDWRDWFIMATVVGGASYGLWALTQRYIKPLIAPPTPPQLEQDKAAIDEQFNRAFALLDTLSSDTTALKEAEEARTKRLDSAIADVEAVVAELKMASQRREDDARRIEAEVRNIKDSLPKAIDNVKDASEKRLMELSRELGSLKLLMGNRFGSNTSPAPSTSHGIPSRPAPTDSAFGSRSGVPTPTAETATSHVSNPAGVSGTAPITPSAIPTNPSYSYPGSVSTPRSKPATAVGPAAGKAAIPAWQMAAQSKAKEIQTPTSEINGIAPPAQDGADAVAALQAS